MSMAEESPGTVMLIERLVSRGFTASSIVAAMHRHVTAREVNEVIRDARRRRRRDREEEERIAAAKSLAARRAAEKAAAEAARLAELAQLRFKETGLISFDELMKAVCQEYGIAKVEIMSRRRHKEVVVARQDLMYRAAKFTLMSLPQIGFRLGGKDHTTVLHGILRHCERNGLPHPRKADACQ